VSHRLQHATGGLLDILPCGDDVAPGGKLQFEDGVTFNLAGLSYVVPHAILTPVEGGPILPLAPLPLYALLKLVAFSDRQAAKDLGSVLHCLEHYLEDDERRYGVEFDGQRVPWEYTCAYLLGSDARPYLDAETAAAVRSVLEAFTDADTDIVGLAAGERGRLFVDDEHRGQEIRPLTALVDAGNDVNQRNASSRVPSPNRASPSRRRSNGARLKQRS
jgi:predicted nucleotidyltransferase